MPSDPGTPDTGADSATPTAPRVCDPIQDGLWSVSGGGFGMAMEATFTFEANKCEFYASDWSMSHPSQMWGGIIDGDQVTLFGSDDYWESCTGTLQSDGTSIVGDCADAAMDGYFDMALIGR